MAEKKLFALLTDFIVFRGQCLATRPHKHAIVMISCYDTLQFGGTKRTKGEMRGKRLQGNDQGGGGANSHYPKELRFPVERVSSQHRSSPDQHKSTKETGPSYKGNPLEAILGKGNEFQRDRRRIVSVQG